MKQIRTRIDHKQCNPQEWMNMGEGDTELQSAILASLLNHIGSLQLQNERLRRELDNKEKKK